MFYFFNRSNVKEWERLLLLIIFSELASELSYLNSQINDGNWMGKIFQHQRIR